MKTPDSTAFSIFGLDIMWYGVLVSLGIASVVVIVCLRAKRHGLTSDQALNISLVSVIAGILCARLYYVIFNWSWYGDDLMRVFKLREGGLAIHGGLIGGLIAALILCRFMKLRPLNVFDLFFAVIPLGQAVGRWGNFFNGEAHGSETSLPWGVVIDGTPYHPTFLYESVWCVLLFAVLIIIDNRRKFEGQTFLLYCIGYSFERFFVEWLRTDSLMLFGVLKQAQVLSAVVFVAAIIAYWYLNRRSGRTRMGGAGNGGAETAQSDKKLMENNVISAEAHDDLANAEVLGSENAAEDKSITESAQSGVDAVRSGAGTENNYTSEEKRDSLNEMENDEIETETHDDSASADKAVADINETENNGMRVTDNDLQDKVIAKPNHDNANPINNSTHGEGDSSE
ncbi:MAG: prolipoprotein diacylglyceryl transferase [Clostridiales Family XIII bacterium]|jgi:phosphatidylglycerol:prolipoprotein diacylglycerol transferase|nr:prolipoprotein diacylglyceryl transferase [Clostridiales Family XIII bacterium]